MSVKENTLRHSIPKGGNRRTESYPIWGVGEVWIQAVTERERQFLESHLVRNGKIDEDARQKHLARWIQATVVKDEQASEYEFSLDDIEALSVLDSKVADSYREAINTHCACRSVEDAKKNWNSDQSD